MWKRIAVLALVLILAILVFRHSGSFLVVNTPEHAELIVVLAGGNNDLRYWNGVQLLHAGWAPRLMLDVINSGSGRNTATEDKFGRVVLPRLFNLGFTTGLMTKDVKLCLAEANALGVPMEVGEVVRRMLQLACDEIGPDKDLTTVVQTIERRAGVEVRAPLAGSALPK